MKKKDARSRPAKEPALSQFPFYEKGKVPQYHKYHGAVSYLDELELIWASAGVPRASGGCARWRWCGRPRPR